MNVRVRPITGWCFPQRLHAPRLCARKGEYRALGHVGLLLHVLWQREIRRHACEQVVIPSSRSASSLVLTPVPDKVISLWERQTQSTLAPSTPRRPPGPRLGDVYRSSWRGHLILLLLPPPSRP